MARVIAMVNQKGGVAKSTRTFSLAGLLVEIGTRVLVIDVDPQANTTSGLGVNLAELDYSLVEVLNRDTDTTIKEVILHTI